MTVLKNKADTLSVNRRGFLIAMGGAGAGLMIGSSLIGKAAEAATPATGAADVQFNPFVIVKPDNTVVVLSKHLDKGQGTASGLATLVADELDAAWDQVEVTFAPANAALYNNLQWGPYQGTGGSSAIPNSFMQYRKAGATAKAMLVEAAARRWGTTADRVTVREGVLTHSSGETLAFGDVAAEAAGLPVPEDPVLKTPDQFTLIGKEDLPRLDVKPKTVGAPIFTLDVKRDGMLVAAIARSPKFGGAVASFDATEAKAVNGVVDVVQIPAGIAVLATSTWPALKAKDLLDIEWDFSAAETRGTDRILAEYRSLAGTPGQVFQQDGDSEAALAGAAQVIESEFTFPFLAHAPMEPLDVVIEFDGKTAEIWTGSQLQTVDQYVTSATLGIEPTDVKINTLWAGGSFGRRAIYDSHIVGEAAQIAKALHLKNGGKKQPIKVQWSREDDIKGGYYRPMYVHRVRAGIDAEGRLVGWHHRIVGQSILTGTPFEAALVHNGIDHTSVEGVMGSPYAIPNFTGELHTTKVGVPGLWWRAVGHTHTAYVMETMLDEIAAAAGKDPVALRRELLKDSPRHLGVLNLAAEKAGWGTPLPAGKARGVAVHKSFESYVAQVAEVSFDAEGDFKVDRVVCAVDCGVAVNPDNIRAQMEGGIGYGIGHALRNEITLTDGEVDQSNFHDYEPMRISDMPTVETHILASAAAPTGVGEPGTPPAAPAVANAVFSATGERLRTLPFSKRSLG
ncbi:MAG: xanthine dehydrogenase family protein molybdopterin-binding subunit [Alphaproteobacteria bacterium]|nr:xanthine dehydrogenase family protein molybdopterin-binding subunit [Alphaproteobacteria bacterium]